MRQNGKGKKIGWGKKLRGLLGKEGGLEFFIRGLLGKEVGNCEGRAGVEQNWVGQKT